MHTRSAHGAHRRHTQRRRIDPNNLRRAGTRADGRPSRVRVLAFSAVVVAVMAVGLFFATSVFSRSSSPGVGMTGNTPAVANPSGPIDLRVSMQGFEPRTIKAKPGQTLTFNWWSSDGAMHLTNGVHTMVSDRLGIHYELPARSSKTISFVVPDKPGEYDYWCDSCCGGKDNPGMHGKIVVEA